MRQDVRQMEDAVDSLWLRLIVGYGTGAAGSGVLMMVFGSLLLCFSFFAAAMLPWVRQCVVVHKAIANVNRVNAGRPPQVQS